MLLFDVILFLFGASIGSFANVIIHRLPLSASVGGRSKCPHCGVQLAWYDLIPIASFIFLAGRCRGCKGVIRWRYPLMELLSGFLFLISFQKFIAAGPGEWLFVVFLLEIFLILFWIDLEHLILPDVLLIAAAAVIIVYGILEKTSVVSPYFSIISMDHVLAAGIYFGIPFLLWLISRGLWLGLGDAKLMAVIGLLFGLSSSFLIVYGAVIVGAVIGIVLLASQKGTRKTKLPFGSLLCVSATSYLLVGFDILEKALLTLLR